MPEPDQTRKALEIFKRLMSRDPAEHAALLAAECRGDAALRRVVESMLRADAASEGRGAADFVEARPIGMPAAGGEDTGGAEAVPARIGQYRIIRRIGAGGMGVVYEAEQEAPRRRVALKVLSSGLFDADRRRRFEREIEVLGRMRHPGIAQVFEGGTLVQGEVVQPYIAMELIDGLELLDHVERHDLSQAGRLELVACIADAAQHAHERGVVHRDLKPANILVDRDGKVKLLDFGVAQVTDADVTRTGGLTRAGDIVGTLSYMSPEQASGRPEDIDTRSDIYAIGVLLYHVLAGRLPYDIDDLPLGAALRVVIDATPAPLPTSCGRDLTTIVGKALEKDRDARYRSASELGADIRRYLRHEPITARRPSAIYHLRKLSQRHKGAAAGVLFVLVLLVATTIFSLDMASSEALAAQAATAAEIEAERQRDEALAARDDAEAVADFLLRTIESVRPERAGRDVPLREVLEPMARQTARAFDGKPRVEAEVWRSLAVSFGALGEFERSLEYNERALELLTAEVNARHPQLWRVRVERALRLHTLGRSEEAERELLVALPVVRSLVDQDFRPLLSTLSGLTTLRRDQKRLEEAEGHAREALALAVEHLGASHPDVLNAATVVAALLSASGRHAESREMLDELHTRGAEELGEDHPDVLLVATSLAQTCMWMRDFARAEELMKVALDGSRRVLGDDHPRTIDALINLAALYQDQGRKEEAAPLLAEATERNGRLLGRRHMTVLALQHNLAVLHASLGRHEEAAKGLAALVAETREVEGLRWLLGIALSKFGAASLRLGQHDTAEKALLESFEILMDVYGEGNVRTNVAVVNLVDLYRALGDEDEVAAWRARLPEGK